jgi:hypothetical protein
VAERTKKKNKKKRSQRQGHPNEETKDPTPILPATGGPVPRAAWPALSTWWPSSLVMRMSKPGFVPGVFVLRVDRCWRQPRIPAFCGLTSIVLPVPCGQCLPNDSGPPWVLCLPRVVGTWKPCASMLQHWNAPGGGHAPALSELNDLKPSGSVFGRLHNHTSVSGLADPGSSARCRLVDFLRMLLLPSSGSLVTKYPRVDFEPPRPNFDLWILGDIQKMCRAWAPAGPTSGEMTVCLCHSLFKPSLLSLFCCVVVSQLHFARLIPRHYQLAFQLMDTKWNPASNADKLWWPGSHRQSAVWLLFSTGGASP